MDKIDNAVALKARIVYLETEQKNRELALKTELQAAQEHLKPANLIKNTVKDIFSAKEIKGHFLDGLLGVLSGYLTKKAVTGASKNPLKWALGSILQAVVTGQVAEHAAPVRSAVMSALHDFLSKKEKTSE